MIRRTGMRLLKRIKIEAAIAAMVLGTGAGAFLMPISAYASDGEPVNGAVYIDLPQGWQTKAVTLPIKSTDAVVYTDNGDTYTSQAKLYYAAFDDEEYKEITDAQAVTIDRNGTLKIKAIYDDGNCVRNSYDIKNFDLEAPVLTASLDGEILYLSASDQISGVRDICVNGKAFTELGAGQMAVNVKDLQEDQEYIDIHADDVAGNMSKQYKLKNPYYVGQIDAGQEDQSLGNPDSVEATDPTRARGTVSDNTVTNGEDGTKEFYTVTASGKTFYLIIDKTMNQDNVYLLTEAGVNDLLNFVDYNGVDIQNGDVPMYEIPVTRSNAEPEIVEDEPEEEPEKEERTRKSKSSNPASMFVLVVIACIGAVAYHLLKNKKRREDLEEAEEMDSYDIPDEENDNEVTETEGDDTEGNEDKDIGDEDDDQNEETAEDPAEEQLDNTDAEVSEITEDTDNIEDQSDDAEPVESSDDSEEEADDIYIGFIEDAPQTGLIDDIQSVEFYDDIPEEAVEGMDIMPEDLAEKPMPVKPHKKRRHKKRR